MPILSPSTSQNYPTLEGVLNLIRSLANDSFAGATNTPGEGQILTDLAPGSTTVYNPFLLSLFNAAIREMYRKLRNVKTPALIKDNYILTALPVVNGPLGASVPDPSVQTSLTFAGYFDGTNTTVSLTLPADLLQPLMMWERATGSQDIFIPMKEGQPLEPRNQLDRLVVWEWRQGQINFLGAIQQRDVRLRYLAVMPAFFPVPASAGYFTSTQIPIFDCDDAVAYLALYKIAVALGSPLAASIKQDANEAMFDLKNAQVRRMQSTRYTRPAYSVEDSTQALDVYGL